MNSPLERINPEYQADIAARVFEGEENDRWLRATSFTYRHQGFMLALSFVLIFASLGILVVYVPNLSLDVPSDHKSTVLWICVTLAYSGIVLMLISMVRPLSRSIWTSILKVILGLLALGAIAGIALSIAAVISANI